MMTPMLGFVNSAPAYRFIVFFQASICCRLALNGSAAQHWGGIEHPLLGFVNSAPAEIKQRETGCEQTYFGV